LPVPNSLVVVLWGNLEVKALGLTAFIAQVLGPEVKGSEAGRELSIALMGASKERRGLKCLFKQNLMTSAMKPSWSAKSEKHQRLISEK